MAKLIYSCIASLDGYIADEQGSFDWAVPDDEVVGFINDLEKPVGTYLYGRRMYELMIGWEQDPAAAAQSPASGGFATMWQAARKIVYSTTLSGTSTARTRLERRFDPEVVRQLKADEAGDLTVAGPQLAAHAFRAGLVDELQLFLTPVVVGGGKPALPTRAMMGLQLLETRRFGNGMVYLRYRTQGPATSGGGSDTPC